MFQGDGEAAIKLYQSVLRLLRSIKLKPGVSKNRAKQVHLSSLMYRSMVMN
jgi:hypothetical protein